MIAACPYCDNNALHLRSLSAIKRRAEVVSVTVKIVQRKAVGRNIANKRLWRTASCRSLEELCFRFIHIGDAFVGIIWAAIGRGSTAISAIVMLQRYLLVLSHENALEPITGSTRDRSCASETEFSY